MDVLDLMSKEMGQSLLRYAVSTAITCPQCGRILDERDAVLVEYGPSEKDSHYAIFCSPCWENDGKAMFDRVLQKARDQGVDPWMSVNDGRVCAHPSLFDLEEVANA